MILWSKGPHTDWNPSVLSSGLFNVSSMTLKGGNGEGLECVM